MYNKNCNLDFIGEVYRNASVALKSIADVIDEVQDDKLKAEIKTQHDGYENFISSLTAYMREKSYEIKDIGAMKKAMMWSAIKMNTAFDNTRSHVAEIMIKGTVMGITELCKILNDLSCVTDEKAIEFARSLKHMEEEFEEKLKKFM